MGQYDGKNVVITGGSSGFGFTTAALLATGGARVLITGRDQSRLDAAKAKLGDNVIAVRSDASSVAEIEDLADRVKSELGTVDALFVNAGINGFAPFEGTSEELYDEIQRVNAKGPYFTVQKLAPLLTSGAGIVLTTSVANVLGLPMLSAYAASKAALRSMTRSLARELLPAGIRVNAISPGPIDSGILEKSMPAEQTQQMKTHMAADSPMQRMGTTEEVAKGVAFLAFEATFTTGAELPVDGGGSQI
ncbi:SDR family oxidoreductase [Amycolatopsis endophytica]|uniref:NAD(P)-dependent dehydrogenase (Short-subunit alcohol dehydrogenase family) n=1 Tax=Amycolatopsis endophytica TaxID=860233 RepID=A0A853AX50_9PSEU|nr:SDR family oxidoreductase [Amycolatopsis endophytica]NYI87205.1 NAD(P)-dependent dehydrogenase (short-subunit alcohol dehydrogenase family) [Amycolatopsis endophytica]